MKKTNIRELTKLAICIALLCVSSYISFPIPFSPAPITAQTIIINLIALILTPRQTAVSIGIYILLGICGLPVFSGGTAGIGRLLGPTGGFIIGFLISAPLISLLKGKKDSILRYLLVTIFVGMPVLDAFGALFMCITQKMNLIAALSAAVVPFLFGDILKCIVGSYLALALNKALKKSA